MERRGGRGERVEMRRGGEGRAMNGKGGQKKGGKGRERTTLRTPCRKFLATPLA